MKKILVFFLLLAGHSVFAQNIGGIGAQLVLDTSGNHTMPMVMGLVNGSPAAEKLKVTDFIVKVNDVSCEDKTLEAIIALIRGEAGTTVKITVADTKEGKNPRVYNMARVNMQVGSQPDPVVLFNDRMEDDQRALKKEKFAIVKTYYSECGNYFFNFEASAGQQYHIRVATLEQKGSGTYTPGFTPAAKVFDNAHEQESTMLAVKEAKDNGQSSSAQMEGTVTFKHACVGTVGIDIKGDAKKCLGMYVIIYK